MARYAICEEVNFDDATGTCSAVTFVDSVPSWLPQLTAEQGAEIASEIAVLWLLAVVLRLVRKSVNYL